MSKNSPISQLSAHYHGWVRAHPTAENDFNAAIEDLLNDGGVTFDAVRTRIKSWASLKAKARTRREDGSAAYPDPVHDINDIIGVRVTVYHSTEIPVALAVLAESFDVIRSVDKTVQTRIAGDFGYGSHHLICVVRTNTEGLEMYAGDRLEIQVRTILQHAWAEFEHDIRYKRGSEPLDPAIDRSFTLAAGLIELADQQFDQIVALQNDSIQPSPDQGEDVPITAETLPGILAVLMGSTYPRSRSETYRWLHEMLLLDGIDTVGKLRELLNPDDITRVTEAMKYRFTPAQVRLIDDLLLDKFGKDHILRTGDTGTRAWQRPKRLKSRLKALQG